MKYTYLIVLLFLSINCFAQISVYDCSLNEKQIGVTELQTYAPATYSDNCINFPDNVSHSYSGHFSKTVEAEERITIDENFSSGDFSSSGQMTLQIQKSDLDVALFAPSALNAIPKYDKLELGVKIPEDIQTRINDFLDEGSSPDQLNPFVIWDVRLKATFTHTSGTVKTVDGFYFRDFQRDMSDPDPLEWWWTEQSTAYNLRVRFAPPMTGKWQAEIQLYVDELLIKEATPFKFNVINSTNPGYVKVAANKKNFQLGNDIVFPMGQNFPWPGDNALPATWGHGSNRDGLSFYLDYYDKLNAYADDGGHFFRMLCWPMIMDIEYEKMGNYNERLDYAWEMDKLFELAEDRGLYIHFNMMMHAIIEKVGSYSWFKWDWDDTWCHDDTEPLFFPTVPYGYKEQLGLTNPRELFTNTNAIKYLEQRYRYMVSRWGYSTSIYLFELLSEAHHLEEVHNYSASPCTNALPGSTTPYTSDPTVRAAVYNFHSEISDYIKNEMGHDEHLISVNYGAGQAPIVSPLVDDDPSYLLDEVDVVSYNWYKDEPQKFFTSSTAYPYNEIENIHNFINKPVVYSETGPTSSIGVCDNWTRYKVDAWNTPFVGIAGMNMWKGHLIENRPQWEHIINAYNHMNHNTVRAALNSNWYNGRDKNDDNKKEVNYYVSADKNTVAGLINNRTFNYHTARDASYDWVPNTNCSDNSNLESRYHLFNDLYHNHKPLKVDNLPSTKRYRVDWYNALTYQYISTSNKWTNAGGKLKLEHPYLCPELPCESDGLRPMVAFIATRVNARSEEESLTESALNVFPNPSSGLFECHLNSNVELPLKITVYSSLGEIVFSSMEQSSQFKLNLKHLIDGVYHLKVSNGKFSIMKKLVVNS